MKNSQLHFIVGIWRSGTTLLREMLAMNHSIKVFEEHSAILQTLQYSNSYSAERTKILQTIQYNKDFIDFSQPSFDFNINQSNFPIHYNYLIEAIYQSTTDYSSKTFIDKNPIYSFYLPQLLKAFPESKFVWMVREPKDNCVSRKKQSIQSFKNSKYLATWWNVTNEIIASSARLHPDRFLLVHYENIVQNTRSQMKDICSFLEIEFISSMLEFEKGKHKRDLKYHEALLRSERVSDELYNSRISSLTENLQKPINQSKIGSWENELSSKETKLIDLICHSNYKKLLENDLDISTPNSIFKALVHLSLNKLKADISKKRK